MKNDYYFREDFIEEKGVMVVVETDNSLPKEVKEKTDKKENEVDENSQQRSELYIG